MRRFLVPSTVVIIVAGVTGAASESLTSKSRSSLFSKQVDVLDGRAAQQYANSVRLQPPDIIVPGAPESVEAFDGRFAGKFLATAKNAARKYGIPEDLFLRLVQQESAWNPNAVSRKGAIGLAQLMPATARALRVNPRDPVQNLEGGARYLATQYKRFRSWRLALAAYNAGPEAVAKYNGIPPYRETQGYVRAILGR